MFGSTKRWQIDFSKFLLKIQHYSEVNTKKSSSESIITPNNVQSRQASFSLPLRLPLKTIPNQFWCECVIIFFFFTAKEEKKKNKKTTLSILQFASLLEGVYIWNQGWLFFFSFFNLMANIVSKHLKKQYWHSVLFPFLHTGNSGSLFRNKCKEAIIRVFAPQKMTVLCGSAKSCEVILVLIELLLFRFTTE